ncbi:hypothetical protein DDZ13_10375 [Coraliomargarita sinensis]|uniref:Uncharacterized protein n=1 Tax=Coraliomargarita sinensis TaxID=2174842 RepID=A0A317ZFP5_9BACT|nr:hypothetical protein [Coraliomargarita sinensis]PXA03692.1 hypothetical protein DDZ13_10375 [Coraliomargarita sinensis]
MLLELEKIFLEKPIDGTGECLVLAELVLPRRAIASRAALKPVRLTKGKRSLGRAAFVDRALLKERVDGPFGLRVAVTRPLRRPELAAMLRTLLAAGIEDLGSELARRVPFGPAGELVDSFGEAVADHLDEDAPDFIAEGALDLDSETLTAGQLTVPLKLTERIRQSDLPPGPKSREKRRSAAKTYRKGSPAGEVILNITPDD